MYPNRPATTALTCDQAIQEAATVPGSEVNNDEVYVTLIACATFDDWAAGVQAKPGVFGMTRITADDLALYAEVACNDAMSTPVCADAAVRGALDY